jgi:hypothetical protein
MSTFFANVNVVLFNSILTFLLNKQNGINIYITFLIFYLPSFYFCKTFEYRCYINGIKEIALNNRHSSSLSNELFTTLQLLLFHWLCIPIMLTFAITLQYCICIAIFYEILEFGSIISIIMATAMLLFVYAMLILVPGYYLFQKNNVNMAKLIIIIPIILMACSTYVVCNVYFESKLTSIILTAINIFYYWLYMIAIKRRIFEYSKMT